MADYVQSQSQYGDNHTAVSTHGYAMFNGDTMLQMSFLDQSVGVTFNRKTPGESHFNRDAKIYAIMRADTAATFAYAIKKDFFDAAYARYQKFIDDPNYEPTEPAVSVSVFTNKMRTNVLALWFDRPVDGKFAPTLSYHTDINPETRMPKATASYTFDYSYYLRGYDPSTGDYNLEGYWSQYDQFVRTIETFINSMTNTDVHASRVNYKKGQQFKNKNTGGMWDTGNPGASVQTQQVDSIDEIMSPASGDDVPF